MTNALKYNPTVCVVGENYQIMIVTWCDALVGIKVGGKMYYNHSNGIRMSAKGVQRFTIPQAELDSAGEYTVISECMKDRSPYFPKKGEAFEKKYKFRPITKTRDIKIYHLADVHGWWDYGVWAAEYFGEEYDLLILNGDISSSSDTFEEMTLCYKIASGVTNGEYPCIISRGNHDLRGCRAEELAGYMPGDNGKSYYTFKLGCIWGILVDMGEDKEDSHPVYGGTVCCHQFRLEQSEMIKNVIKNSDKEYGAEDVKYKLIISHVPFTFKKDCVVEKELYSEWTTLIKNNIKPDLMLCGHTHTAGIYEKDNELDELGQPCTVIVGSAFKDNDKSDVNNVLAGAYIKLSGDCAEVKFNTKKGILGEGKVML